MIQNQLIKGERTMLMPEIDPDTMVAEILQDLPPETERLAREFKAFSRARKIKTPAQLLRAVRLFAGLDLTEREVAANLVLVDPTIRSLTDQAVHERLQACLPWLQALLPKLLPPPPGPLPPGRRLLVIDATNVTAPGERKTTWRLHVVMNLMSLELISVQLTDGRTGETLKHFDFAPGDVVLCDRGYCRREGVAHLLAAGGEVIVCYHPHLFPVQDRQGRPLDVAAARRDLAPGETVTLEADFVSDAGITSHVWIHTHRLAGEAAAAARRRCRRTAQQGRYTPRQASLFLAEFVLVLSSVPPQELNAEVVLGLYRCRWQVELLIKCWKSLLDLDQVRARAGSVLGRVWLTGKLLYAAWLERRGRRRFGADWRRLNQQRRTTCWRLWKLLQHEVAPLITLACCWATDAWPAALQALTERKRRRRLQTLPVDVIAWVQPPATPPIQEVSIAA
jgi:hypothetical protein